MASLRRNVSSLSALAAFEAAARLGGFTKAAQELGVTQAAISRHIRTLETDLATPLFLRTPRQVVLTDAGRILADAVSGAFETMSEAVERLREPTGPITLTVSTSLSFAHFWLLPRLPAFRLEHPELILRVLSQDQPVDLARDEADVVVRYGRPPFADGVPLATLSEEVYPLAAPDFVAKHDAAGSSLEWLATLPLIEGHAPGTRWLTWSHWFSRAGYPISPSRRMLVFSHYSDAVYAAMAGEGVVLGWRRLLERTLADGRLARVGGFSVSPEEAHHIVMPRDGAKPAATLFADWLIGRFGAEEA